MTTGDDPQNAERYVDLDPAVRKMLEELRPDEVVFLQRLIRTMSAFGTVGRALFIVGAAAIGIVIGIPALIDALARIANWLHLAK